MRNPVGYCLLAVTLLWPLSADSQEEDLMLADSGIQPPPEHLRWLDEVRAQREAWEARRQAAKESADAHLRLIDPWGAARKEALERDADARRQALRNRAQKERDAHQQELNRLRRERERFWQFYMPYDWDTRWYYRGY